MTALPQSKDLEFANVLAGNPKWTDQRLHLVGKRSVTSLSMGEAVGDFRLVLAVNFA